MKSRPKEHEKNKKMKKQKKQKKGTGIFLAFVLVWLAAWGDRQVFQAAQPQNLQDYEKAKVRSGRQKGDADGDGRVTLLDARQILRAALHLAEIEEEDRGSADVDMDGRMTLRDAGFALKFALNLMQPSHFVCVGEYADFQTINEAVSYARTFCTKTDRVLIFIGEGTYQEEITLLDNPGIDMEGSGAGKTLIEQQSWYPAAPLYTTGTGTFKNLALIARGSTNSYAMHFEINGGTVRGVTTFQNCFFCSEGNAAVGV